MDSQENSIDLRKRVALLAKAMGLTQSEIAVCCHISRLTIHRYFCGQTELRAKDFIKILKILNIDIENEIDSALDHSLINSSQPRDPFYMELALLFQHLESRVKKTLMEQIAWWIKLSENPLPRRPLLRIQSYLNQPSAQEKP